MMECDMALEKKYDYDFVNGRGSNKYMHREVILYG